MWQHSKPAQAASLMENQLLLLSSTAAPWADVITWVPVLMKWPRTVQPRQPGAVAAVPGAGSSAVGLHPHSVSVECAVACDTLWADGRQCDWRADCIADWCGCVAGVDRDCFDENVGLQLQLSLCLQKICTAKLKYFLPVICYYFYDFIA